MGKASSAKKVARAERAGSTTRTTDRRAIGFPLAVVLIIVLGIALVAFARTTRDAVAAPTLSDHWHSAYGIYDCATGSYLPDLEDVGPDVLGIHTHGDGLMHIHPFSANATGKGAILEVFLDQVQVDVSADAITLSTGERLEAGVDCDGEPAVIQVLRWSNALEAETTAPEVITEDMEGARLLNDIEAFAFVRAPLGAEIPPPPSIPNIEQVTDIITVPTPIGGTGDEASG